LRRFNSSRQLLTLSVKANNELSLLVQVQSQIDAACSKVLREFYLAEDVYRELRDHRGRQRGKLHKVRRHLHDVLDPS
jgi:hypothetical protein